MEKFRQIGMLSEFFHELTAMSTDQTRFQVWQNLKGTNRILNQGKIQKFDIENEKVILQIELEESSQFKKENPIYVYDELKGILFKGRLSVAISHQLRTVADNKVFMKEKRALPRVNFFYTKVLADALFGGKIPFTQLKLKDVSEMGFSILVNETKAKGLIQGLTLSLTKIQSITLPVPLEGVIAHKTSNRESKVFDKDLVSVGVKLSQPSSLISTVMNEMQKKRSDV